MDSPIASQRISNPSMPTRNSPLRRQISRPRNLIATTNHVQFSSETPLLSPHMAATDPNSNPSPLCRSPQKPPPLTAVPLTPSSAKPSPRSLLLTSKQQSQPITNGGNNMTNATNQRLCLALMFLSFLPSLYVLYSSHQLPSCIPTSLSSSSITTTTSASIRPGKPINLLPFPSAWNHLPFSSSPPRTNLKIALFVKRWPHRAHAGGLERHALTLHLALARRGHELHVFTTNSSSTFDTPTPPTYPSDPNLHIHVTPPSPAGLLNQPLAWSQFLLHNSTGRPFEVVHSESVGLFHGRARNVSTLAVSWHGIAYETIHSDIVQELNRRPDEHPKPALTERIAKVVDEVKFFKDYAHHVATSDHVGDVLRRVYMLPEERVHVILNGVDEGVYRPDDASGNAFLREIGVPVDKRKLVVGVAGRLVKDKGHPIMFEALKQLFDEEDGFRGGVSVLVAGNGPWASRYRSLGPNMFVLGSLEQARLARFYNSLDVFVNPTLRAQGLDHTFLEAMMCGVAVLGTRFASVTGSVVVGPEMGYTFHPTVGALKEALRGAWREGKGSLRKKGEVGRERALRVFTATKMALSYERLFLCIAQNQNKKDNSKEEEGGGDHEDYCTYVPT